MTFVQGHDFFSIFFVMIVDFSLEITKIIRYNGVISLFNPFIFFSCVVCTIIEWKTFINLKIILVFT